MSEPIDKEQAKTRRKSTLNQELKAFEELVNIMRPLNAEQRTRLVASAIALLGPGN